VLVAASAYVLDCAIAIVDKVLLIVGDSRKRQVIDELQDLLHLRLGVAALIGQHHKAKLRRIPRVPVAHLGNRAVPLLMDAILDSAQHRALVLIGVTVFELQGDATDTDDHLLA
jgi:hypothetical protein